MSGPDTAWVAAGRAGLAVGRVVHHRSRPAGHRFAYPMTQIWIDPDRPEELFDLHPLWSPHRPAPARFRARDYLDGRGRGLGVRVRERLAAGLGRPVDGPLRMLTQPRIWGWLFNPITVYLAWDGPTPSDPGRCDDPPAAALLEVTNTPWKERHWYPVGLEQTGSQLTARFAKELHVSPFLTLDHVYTLRLHRRDHSMLDLTLDVDPTGGDGGNGPDRHRDPGRSATDPDPPLLHTRLTTHLHRVGAPDTRPLMGAALRPTRLSTHRVSAGIHRQALSLWRRGVPFVPHPTRSQ